MLVVCCAGIISLNCNLGSMSDLSVSKRLFTMRNFSLCNIWVLVSGYGQVKHAYTNSHVYHYKKIGNNINVLKQTAYLVVNPITVGNFTFLFNCTSAGQTLDFTMVPT